MYRFNECNFRIDPQLSPKHRNPLKRIKSRQRSLPSLYIFTKLYFPKTLFRRTMKQYANCVQLLTRWRTRAFSVAARFQPSCIYYCRLLGVQFEYGHVGDPMTTGCIHNGRFSIFSNARKTRESFQPAALH